MSMLCRITDLHNKEVINICDGCRLGCVDDVEIDTCNYRLVSIIVHGRPKCFGLLGYEEDIIIPCKDIEVIGEETILVNFPGPCFPKRKKGGFFSNIFGGLS